MKRLALCTVILFPIVALAQGWGGMDSKDMQGMMNKAKEAQACMEKIDQGRLDELKNEAQLKTGEIKAMCVAGQRAEAQTTAVAYGKKIAADPTLKELQKCVTELDAAIPQAAWGQLEEAESGPTHVCDLQEMQ